MPHRNLRRIAPNHAPADDLARAIADIDKRLKQIRLANEPIPFDAYRARRILVGAHARCLERVGSRIPLLFNTQLHGSIWCLDQIDPAGTRLSDTRRSRVFPFHHSSPKI